jgi:hypothetical protein
MIHGPVLAMRKFLVNFILFYLLLLNPKITKTLTHFALFWFYKLASCWCLKATIVSWRHKAVCLLLQVAKRVKKRNHLSLPQEFDINPESPVWGKFLLLHHSTPGVPTSGTLKNRGVTSHAARAAPGCTFASIGTISFSTMMTRE